jgi:glycine hydroxymethyltransferase
MADEMMKRGYRLMTNGTANHLILWDVSACGLSGRVAEKAFDLVNIFTNKNTIATDKNAFSPSGVRVGTSAITARGLKEDDVT